MRSITKTIAPGSAIARALSKSINRAVEEDPRGAEVALEMCAELASAREKHAPMNSAHEAAAVIMEELDEFWEIVKQPRERRDPAAMRAELIQIAAMACRAIIDLEL